VNNPVIKPNVVIIPEVIPNPKPLFIEFFMMREGRRNIKV
jgi:hypothetical protein